MGKLNLAASKNKGKIHEQNKFDSVVFVFGGGFVAGSPTGHVRAQNGVPS
ncbi:MAG TPA: hypothetical protein PLQ88_02950 [Blastocatellia bacterium]|nr:hypothetical protein [Blastocatellia bacterium]